MRTINNQIEDIIKRVEAFTNQKVRSHTRKREVVEARQIAMYLIRKNTSLTYQQIATVFNLKHYTTVREACNNVSDLLKYDKNYKDQYSNLIELLMSNDIEGKVKPQELRVGNLLKDQNGNAFEVVGLEVNKIQCIPPLVCGRKVEPIPLTEKILKQFGFVEDNRFAVKQWQIDGQKYHSLNLFKSKYWNPVIRCESQKQAFQLYGIQYVHQLQNLYFALTGNELILNTK